MDSDDIGAPHAFLCCCFCVILITSLSLFGVSYDTISPLQAGLKFNTVTEHISNEKTYGPGRYFLGVGVKFLKFPVNMRNLEWLGSWPPGTDGDDRYWKQRDQANYPRPELTAWSKEGQNINLELSLQYRLNRDHLREIYYRFGTRYHEIYANIVTEALKEITVRFETVDFFTLRREISEEMIGNVHHRLFENHAILQSFQLRKITIPSGFDAKVREKVVVREGVRRVRNERLSAQIRAESLVITTQGESKALVIRTNATKEGKIVIAATEARRRTIELNAQKTAFQAFGNSMGLDEEGILQYAWIRTWKDRVLNRNTRLVTGFEHPILEIN